MVTGPNKPEIITFDAPGASAGTFAGTVAEHINPVGVIAGYYSDASGVNHGFVRAPDGKFTVFDAPGAGAGSGQGTIAGSNDLAGAITGYYVDASNAYHGFLRRVCPRSIR